MKTFSFFLTGLMVLALVGCNDDDNAEPKITIDEFVGSWIAESMTLTNNADPSQQFDLVANGGEIRITMLAGGNVRTWIEFGDFSDEWDAKVVMDGNKFISTPVEPERGVRTSVFEYDGTRLTLTNANDSFDFTLSGEPDVSATSVGVYVRQ